MAQISYLHVLSTEQALYVYGRVFGSANSNMLDKFPRELP